GWNLLSGMPLHAAWSIQARGWPPVPVRGGTGTGGRAATPGWERAVAASAAPRGGPCGAAGSWAGMVMMRPQQAATPGRLARAPAQAWAHHRAQLDDPATAGRPTGPQR